MPCSYRCREGKGDRGRGDRAGDRAATIKLEENTSVAKGKPKDCTAADSQKCGTVKI